MLSGQDLHDSNRIIIKDRGDVFGGKLVCCVGDEQTCFSHSTVSNHDTPEGVFWLASEERQGRQRKGIEANILDSSDDHIEIVE